MYIYPAIDYNTGELYEFKDVVVPDHFRGLLNYMIDNNKIEALEKFDYNLLNIKSDEVLAKITRHEEDENWDNDVPYRVGMAIKRSEERRVGKRGGRMSWRGWW